MEYDKINKSEKIAMILVFLLVGLLIVLEIFPVQLTNDLLVSDMILNSLSRAVSAVVFILILVSFGYSNIFKAKGVFSKTLLVAIPALLISINNFPLIAHFSGRTELINPLYTVVLLAFESLSTGLLEEIIFRGLLLIVLLQKLPHTRKGILSAILISSFAFSFIHIVNVFVGVSFSQVMLQVGYSFLVGAMWSVVFLKTKNIYIVILLHALYNFGGLLFNTLGTVSNQFDTPTVIITSILSVFVIGYYIKVFMDLDISKTKDLYE